VRSNWGLNHIDTAQFYGPDVANENSFGRRCIRIPEDLALVSKVGGRRDDTGAWLPLSDPADFRRDLEAQPAPPSVSTKLAAGQSTADGERRA